jgi:hypothetical protein
MLPLHHLPLAVRLAGFNHLQILNQVWKKWSAPAVFSIRSRFPRFSSPSEVDEKSICTDPDPALICLERWLIFKNGSEDPEPCQHLKDTDSWYTGSWNTECRNISLKYRYLLFPARKKIRYWYLVPLKGTVARDFRPSVFFINQSHLSHWLTG